MVMSLFTATPKAKTREITKDSGTRSQNDAFGSLVIIQLLEHQLL